MRKILIVFLLAVFTLFIVGCTQTVRTADIKDRTKISYGLPTILEIKGYSGSVLLDHNFTTDDRIEFQLVYQSGNNDFANQKNINMHLYYKNKIIAKKILTITNEVAYCYPCDPPIGGTCGPPSCNYLPFNSTYFYFDNLNKIYPPAGVGEYTIVGTSGDNDIDILNYSFIINKGILQDLFDEQVSDYRIKWDNTKKGYLVGMNIAPKIFYLGLYNRIKDDKETIVEIYPMNQEGSDEFKVQGNYTLFDQQNVAFVSGNPYIVNWLSNDKIIRMEFWGSFDESDNAFVLEFLKKFPSTGN